MSTGQVRTEDADIVYDREGAGPLLLTIAGRGGTGSRFAGISDILKDEFTVVRYDRRGCGRSNGHLGRPMDLAQHARDAIAVATALGFDQAQILGQSAGAAIAMRLAELYPEVLAGLVLHEPMIPSILPDAAAWIEFTEKVDATYHAQGAGPAMTLLATSMVGLPNANGGPDQPQSARGAPDPFLEHELMSVCCYRPDMGRVGRNRTRLIVAKGRLSGDAYYARTADVIGERLGCPVHVLSGNHIAFAADPATFASEIRPLLRQLAGPGGPNEGSNENLPHPSR